MKRIPLYLLLVLLITACGFRPIAYGLVLWGEGEFETGQIVRIIKESQIQKAYLVQTGTSKELAAIPFWRVRSFPAIAEAESAAETYRSFTLVYGYSERDGLPVREEARHEAKRVGTLGAGEVVLLLAPGRHHGQYHRSKGEPGYQSHSTPTMSNFHQSHVQPQRA